MGVAYSNHLGIVCAIYKELEAIKGTLTITDTIIEGNYIYYIGKIKDVDVILLQAGEGSYAMEYGTLNLITKFNPKAVILAGIAGTNNPKIKIADIVICLATIDKSALIYSEAGYQAPYKVYKDPHARLSFLWANKYMASKLSNYLYGVSGSSNTYTQKIDWIKAVESVYPTDAHDNETMAMAYACSMKNKPWLAIRSISDRGYTPESNKAYTSLAQAVSELIPQLNAENIDPELATENMLSLIHI